MELAEVNIMLSRGVMVQFETRIQSPIMLLGNSAISYFLLDVEETLHLR